MNRWGQKTIVVCCVIGVVLAAVQSFAARTPITAEQVAEVLVSEGMPITAGQIKFLSPVSAAKPNFALQLVSAARWGKDNLKAELRCHDHACLPFYVLLTGAGTVGTRGGSSSRTVAANIAQIEPVLTTTSAKQILMRDGDKATLIFENTSLRISMPVICLQSGSRGQQIRVVTTDHKRFFKAEIVAAGLLKAMI